MAVTVKAGRLSKAEKNLIIASIGSFHEKTSRKDVKEIQQLLIRAGFIKRKENNLLKIINKIKKVYVVKEKRKLARQKWNEENPIKYRARALINGCKYRTKKRAERIGEETLPLNVTTDFIEEKLKNGVCEATGFAFNIKKYESDCDYTPIDPRAPSIDRIDPAGFYTMDNIRVVCDQVNKAMSDKTDEETARIAFGILEGYIKNHGELYIPGDWYPEGKDKRIKISNSKVANKVAIEIIN